MVEQELFTDDEAALYDRQIRLWGLDAQKRLRAARVLVVGLKGLGAEVCKNVVLAGVKSLTLLDNHKVSEDDFNAQFFVTRTDIGKNRALRSVQNIRDLNPMVEVNAEDEDVTKKPEQYFLNFDVVCLTNIYGKDLIRINNICHQHNIKFFSGDVYGYFGHVFVDLVEHEYVEEIMKPSKSTDENGIRSPKKLRITSDDSKIIKKSMSYVRFEDTLKVDWSLITNKSKLKRMRNSFFIMKVLQDFKGADHGCLTPKEISSTVLQVAKNVANDTKVPCEKMDLKFTNYCIGELSPVCAIVGGILSQQIVKAVSHKDQPFNNVFFYDGLSSSGIVDCIGR